MALNSTPKPDGATITGGSYNQLLEDVRENHDHSGNRNGTKIDHINIVENGQAITKSHATLEGDISALQGKLPYQKIIYGKFDEVTATSGAGWSATVHDWDGGKGKTVAITFDPPLPSVPIVTANPMAGDDEEAGDNTWRYMAPVGTWLRTVTASYVEITNVINTYQPEFDGVPDPVRMHFIAICP